VAEAATVRAAEAAEAKTDGSTVVGIKPLWKEKNLCPNCNKVVVYDPATCFSLEANKDKCLAEWGTKRGE
jgi:hypothetical protein